MFRKTSLSIDIDPFVDSIRADEDFRKALETELHKAIGGITPAMKLKTAA
ncbi:hypothetical protein FIV00_25890 [Labrenzia sp. THAF82]|nr:hypothetical protein [Labrenzia sp. THAF82]QFT33954.1 hypothetical protein FIV00_25890 [Labrenzia sp. THAF82]